jgi:hypothetical protein
MQQLNHHLYSRLWPEAEDRALRGRNPSAVFRTLYRQAGRLPNELPSCALPWRVETQCDKSTPPIFLSPEISQRTVRKSLFSNKQTFKQNTPSDCPFSRGKPTLAVSGSCNLPEGSRTFRRLGQPQKTGGLRGFARPCKRFGAEAEKLSFGVFFPCVRVLCREHAQKEQDQDQRSRSRS